MGKIDNISRIDDQQCYEMMSRNRERSDDVHCNNISEKMPSKTSLVVVVSENDI